MNTDPHLEVIVGTMFSGKSTELIRRINRYEVIGKGVQMFKPATDDRYSKDHVTSHDGLRREVPTISGLQELRQKYKPEVEVMAVDEAQFLESGIVGFMEEHVNRGGIGVVSILLKDFRDQYFRFRDGHKDASEFIRVADHVMYLKALCKYEQNQRTCGNEATRVQRFIDGEVAPLDSPLVMVGGKESYEPRCRQHFRFYP